MKRVWWLLLVVLTLADAWLIANPNLLGKLGFIIFKYHYLRTFPRALLTVVLAVGIVFLIVELLIWLNQRQVFSRKAVAGMLITILILLIVVLIKTALDFQSWAYDHTGHKLKYGAYLLPLILILVVGIGLIRVLRHKPKFSESQRNENLL
ncbi:MAG: hypothetical protein DYG99_08485 [Bacteroidetes bacterium CHB5]|nr:hypothetical protein [Bacteroidetes bacterium CHB5]